MPEPFLFTPTHAVDPETPALGFHRYTFTADARMAIDVAIATGRPLLVLGPPGCGKTQLAEAAAWHMGLHPANFHRMVVTSRTEADDLMWRYDALSRLRDARAGDDAAKSPDRYVHPGPLWHALDPAGVGTKRVQAEVAGRRRKPGGKPTAVVLIDEIDKAEPEVPNNLLDVLDAGRFEVPELRGWVEASATANPLVVLTSNRERALSPAFLRRCVVLALGQADAGKLVEIATAHFGGGDERLYRAVAGKVCALRDDFANSNEDRPGTAEYLDAVSACRDLGITPPPEGAEDHPPGPARERWSLLTRLVLAKPQQAPVQASGGGG